MQEYGPEADLWSVGMLLYQLLTGTFPFWDSVQNISLQQARPCAQHSGLHQSCMSLLISRERLVERIREGFAPGFDAGVAGYSDEEDRLELLEDEALGVRPCQGPPQGD